MYAEECVTVFPSILVKAPVQTDGSQFLAGLLCVICLC